MRRIWAIVLTAVMLFSLVACAPSAQTSTSGITESDNSSTPVEGTLTTTTGRTRTTMTTTTTTTTTAADRSSVTTTTTSAAPTKTTATTTAAPTKAQKLIVCWGASTTQGMGMSYGNKYPDYLQSLLGDDYFVWNGGYAGDSSTSVAARQGALKLKTKEAITFADGVKTVTIGHRVEGMGLLLEDGTELTRMNINQAVSPTARWERMLDINPVTINGQEYTLGRTYEGMPEPYKDGYYYVTLTRTSSSGNVTIPAGSVFALNGIDETANACCDIYYLVGVNDGFDNPTSDESIAYLIRRIREMVEHHGHDNYLVVIPQWSSKFDAAYEEAFGERAVNLRELACERGLEVEGITPTADDKTMIVGGEVPVSLRYQNNRNEVHLNKYGYHFLATILYERGQQLGYWK